MNTLRVLLSGALLTCFLWGQQSSEPHKIKVLIITGQDKHPWREASPYLRGLLEQTNKFEVRVTEEFHGATAETLAPYDVAVMVYSDEKLPTATPWSQQTKDALLSFVRSGKGLVVYHHSAASFQEWPEYENLIGCRWRTGVSHHSPVHDYQVDIKDSAHPVMQGLSAFMAQTDELYAGLECSSQNPIHVLATGLDDHSLYRGKPHEKVPDGPSQNEPLIWTLNYGSGHVFATMLGNDMRAVHTPGFISTFVRGTEWAATGQVTIPPAPGARASTPAGRGWTTFGGDAQRSGWARNETTLNRNNARDLELKWKLQLDNKPKELTSLTAPVVADQVKTQLGLKELVIVAGSSDNVTAIDADTGKIAWQRTFDSVATPAHQPNTLCPFALNATPAIAPGRPGTTYAIASDGRLFAMSTVTGEDRFPPKQLVAPFSKTWSLNLYDNVLYTAVSQRCNDTLSGVFAMDLNLPDHPVREFSSGRPGIWGRASVAISSKTGNLYVETGDGSYNPDAGQWADSLISLSKDLRPVDYFTPANREWLTRKDLDMGNITPLPFEFKGKEYVLGSGKEGKLYLLDGASLGGKDHRQPFLATTLFTMRTTPTPAMGSGVHLQPGLIPKDSVGSLHLHGDRRIRPSYANSSVATAPLQTEASWPSV